MNYERIGELPPPDDDRSFYGSERNFSDAARIEAIKAKTFLSVVTQTSNISTYDHLRNLVEKIIRLKVENAVDTIESISQSLKWERYEAQNGFKTIPEVDDRTLTYINRISNLFEDIRSPRKDINVNIKDADDDAEPPPIEDEDVNDSLEDDPERPVTPPWHPSSLYDVCHHMYRFRQNGFGLSHDEAFLINLSIKAFATKNKLENIRFWGKIFGTKRNYYVVEVPFTEGIPIGDYGWKHVPEILVEEVIKEEPHDEDVKNDQTISEILSDIEKTTDDEIKSDAEETKPEEKPIEPIIPPLPKLQPPPAEPILAEKNGRGVNKYMYFVTNSPGESWNCLPQLQPNHIVDARLIKKYFTGILETKIGGCPRFQGVEAHYLRAQIARISAGTILSPTDYYRMREIGQEGELPTDELANESETEENLEYRPLSTQDLVTRGMDIWTHARKGISPEGCCSWKYVEEIPPEEPLVPEGTPEEPKNEGDEEIQKEEKIDLQPIPRLRSIAEDKGAGGVVPWTLRSSSLFLEECGVLLARSNVWPGAVAYNDGSNFENMYIGYGHKYKVRHYAPKLVEKWQKEYEAGPDLLEPEDPIIEPEPEPEVIPQDEEQIEVKEEQLDEGNLTVETQTDFT